MTEKAEKLGLKKGEKTGLGKVMREMLVKGFLDEVIREIIEVDKAFI